ncbi:sensor histidine kinase [Nesterenkonia lutea]|uniref:histidine kinase n=1 Tax=Nesterenkonia lutea TaxID=272919 RepID=A0ABR9JDB4_9MICC|nr:histidine kinase [Nesterenkonia lutea]MBE1523926.1 signal transduction histidine kinase [Nesterenkonia lutea]
MENSLAHARPPITSRTWTIAPSLIVLAIIPLLFAVPEFTSSGPSVPLTVATLVVQAVLLLGSQRFPGTVLAAVAIGDCVLFALDHGNTSAGIAVLFAAYFARRLLSRRRAARRIIPWAVISVVIAASTGAPAEIAQFGGIPLAIARGFVLYGLGWVVAEIVIGRSQLIQALIERAEIAEREQELVAQQAVHQQRTMIARELHDIAAHHLTGIIVSAQAASALAQRDPQAQRGYLSAVQRDARSALENLRRTVGLLRGEEGAEALPAPSMADLPQVIREAAARGVPLQLREQGEPWPLGPVAGVVVIRGIQEAVANIAKHAPGADAVLTVDWEADRLSVEVQDDGAASPSSWPSLPASGYGLTGLSERLALVHGRLSAAPTATGWRTAFSIPREHTEAGAAADLRGTGDAAVPPGEAEPVGPAEPAQRTEAAHRAQTAAEGEPG